MNKFGHLCWIIKTALLRTIFFPLWIYFLIRRHRSVGTKPETLSLVEPVKIPALTPEAEQVYKSKYQVADDTLEDVVKRSLEIDGRTHEPEPEYEIEILDINKNRIHMIPAQMKTESGNSVLHGSFESTKYYSAISSRAYHRGEPMDQAVEIKTGTKISRGDKVSICHTVIIKRLIFNGGIYHLEYGNTLQTLGAKIIATLVDWRPKATDGVVTTYNESSLLYRKIIAKDGEFDVRYGIELTLKLANGEEAFFFCGTKTRRAALIAQGLLITGVTWTLTSKKYLTQNMSWHVVEFEHYQFYWFDKRIEDLDDKHLYNIIAAIRNGHWANGNKIRVRENLQVALKREYGCRDYDEKSIKKIKKKNKKWEKKFCTQGVDPNRTYNCKICKKKK